METLTRNSTKHVCESSVSIMYCIERNPRLSIRIEILLDKFRAFVEGFSNVVLYLQEGSFVFTVDSLLK